MDYAFGEQAYETIDELLKPYKINKVNHFLNVESVSIMGKAGILEGGKGDIMIPNAHVNEGTADNYYFQNELTASMFEGNDIPVYAGPMITVLGTSLQNKDLLKFFHESTWGAIGLEMEGAYYQKAIQSASMIRKKHQYKCKSTLRLLCFRQPTRNRKHSSFRRIGNNRCKTNVFNYHKNFRANFQSKITTNDSKQTRPKKLI